MMYHLTPLVEERRAQNEGLLFVSEKFSLYYDDYTRTGTSVEEYRKHIFVIDTYKLYDEPRTGCRKKYQWDKVTTRRVSGLSLVRSARAGVA